MACLWPASYGVNAGFHVFVASHLCGIGRVVELTIGRWANKNYNVGGESGGVIAPGDMKPHRRQAKTSLVLGMRGRK